MKMEYFYYLLEISRLRSISSAARELGITQMKLSTIVKRVEDEVNYSIFQRTPNGVTLTPAGNRFMDLAWKINLKYENILRLRNQHADNQPVTTLLLPPSAALLLAIPLTQRFYQYNVSSKLAVVEKCSQDIKEDIKNNSANIGIVQLTEFDYQKYQSDYGDFPFSLEFLGKSFFKVMVSKDHPFAEKEKLTPQDLAGAEIAQMRVSNGDSLSEMLAINGKRVTGFCGMDAVCRAVLECGMAGIVPGILEKANTTIRTSDYKFISLPDRQSQPLYFCLLTSNNRELRYQEQILRSCIKECCHTIFNVADLSASDNKGGDFL